MRPEYIEAVDAATNGITFWLIPIVPFVVMTAAMLLYQRNVGYVVSAIIFTLGWGTAWYLMVDHALHVNNVQSQYAETEEEILDAIPTLGEGFAPIIAIPYAFFLVVIEYPFVCLIRYFSVDFWRRPFLQTANERPVFHMTDSDLDRIEGELGIAIPAEYRQVAIEFPFREIGNDWIYWFYADAERVIGSTREPLLDGRYGATNWQPSYLVIGEGAAGDLHVMDTASDGLPVHILCHETHEIEPEWRTFALFVDEWQNDSEAIQEQQRESMRSPTANDRGEVWEIGVVLSVVVLICLSLLFSFIFA